MPNTREALHDMSNSSKVGVSIVLVTREDHETNVNPFFFKDDVAKVLLPLEMPSLNIGPLPWLTEIRDSEPSSGRLYSLTA